PAAAKWGIATRIHSPPNHSPPNHPALGASNVCHHPRPRYPSPAMASPSAAAARFRILVTRGLSVIGFRDDSFLLVIAALVGVVTAGAALGFHELIYGIRHLLYRRL